MHVWMRTNASRYMIANKYLKRVPDSNCTWLKTEHGHLNAFKFPSFTAGI